MKTIAALLIALLVVGALLCTSYTVSATSTVAVGVWNNSDFSKPESEWADAAQRIGGSNGLVDLTVALAGIDGIVYFPFPYESSTIYRGTSSDKLEPYLSEFESRGLKVILSLQPLGADVKQLIGIILSRYSNHKNILGINVDVEWKNSGELNHVNNEERDLWLNELQKYNATYKLFLTYFKDYTYFPEDHNNVVILYDGEDATQATLLSLYSDLAKHFSSVGIYTGYSSATPPAASYDRIMNAVPKTQYIIHTEDVFSSKHILIFEMDDVQIDWLESLSINLTEIHIQKQIPVLIAAIPKNFDNRSVGGGYLPVFLKNVSVEFLDVIEVGQHGYTHNDTEYLDGKSYEEQKMVIAAGQNIFSSLGINVATFIAPFGVADNNTLKAAKDLGFKNFVSVFSNLTSTNLTMVSSCISLTEEIGNNTVLKSVDQLVDEIDEETGNATIVLYQIFDFERNNQSKLASFSFILDELKATDKYSFMTMEQYREASQDSTWSAPNHKPETPPYLIIAAIAVGALVAIIAVLVSARYFRSRKAEKAKSTA
jgi:peptidoglycan/xylan/chitin deacetylase (PgdA/CDA1 family)